MTGILNQGSTLKQTEAPVKVVVMLTMLEFGTPDDQPLVLLMVLIFLSRGAFSWSIKPQPTLAGLTTEAGCLTSFKAVEEALWLKKFWNSDWSHHNLQGQPGYKH